MDVIRGRGATVAADREATVDALARCAEAGRAVVRVWSPHPQVAFGRRDARADGFERAKRAARDCGLDPVERDVGGRAVAYTGETLAFAVTVPLDDERAGIDARYDLATATVADALRGLGADVAAGEPDRAFCPGAHSIRVAGGGKVAGIAQRVRSGAALVAGCLVVSTGDEAAIADALAPVYDALGVPFAPSSVGSVASAGGPGSPARVAEALETALVTGPWGDGSRRIERLAERPLRDGGGGE